MRLEHNQICTWNSEVEMGNSYLFTEGSLECKVKVVKKSQQKEGICLHMKVIQKPLSSPFILGEEFEVVASSLYRDSNRWWYIHDPDLITF